jgi:hypothetical protein
MGANAGKARPMIPELGHYALMLALAESKGRILESKFPIGASIDENLLRSRGSKLFFNSIGHWRKSRFGSATGGLTPQNNR